MASILTSSSERVIAQCDRGIYEPCEGSEPLDLLARGMVERHTGSLELAKDLLSQAYWSLDGEWKDKAGVQLSAAYYQGGEKEEAWALLDSLPASFDALLMQAIVQADTEPELALELLARAEAYDVSGYKWGRLHSQCGICFRRLGQYGRAEEEYRAALYFLADCPLRHQVENNWAHAIRDTERAHGKLNGAIEGLSGPCLAQAYESKARAFLSENEIERAERYATWAIDLLESGERRAWLAESLLTRAEIYSKQQREIEALNDLHKVSGIAEYLGDSELKFRSAKEIDALARRISKTYHTRCVRMALESCGSLNAAARKLDMSRQGLQDFMRRNDIPDRARRSIFRKS